MQGIITAPFFFQNKWFFSGASVEGATATAAKAAGCLAEPKKTKKATKALKASPENKDATDG